MTKVENGIMPSKNNAGNSGQGSYVLLIRILEEPTITIGKLNTIRFPAGDYAYVGSAMNGLNARLSRHLRRDKKLHWHIDYLLQRASIHSIILCESRNRTECTIARAFQNQFEAIPGFGASDCRCRSHLFFSAEEMEREIMTVLSALGMKPSLTRVESLK